jgi:hypothetical protein
MPGLLIGCAGNGALHHDGLSAPSVDDSFAMVKQLPILAGTCGYTLGGDSARLEDDLAISRRLGLRLHNMIPFANSHSGSPLTDLDVAEFYLRAWSAADSLDMEPCFEVHIDTWSEDFRRVRRMAEH